MPEFIDTIRREVAERLAEVERQLGEYDTLRQERERLKAALEALGGGGRPSLSGRGSSRKRPGPKPKRDDAERAGRGDGSATAGPADEEPETKRDLVLRGANGALIAARSLPRRRAIARHDSAWSGDGSASRRLLPIRLLTPLSRCPVAPASRSTLRCPAHCRAAAPRAAPTACARRSPHRYYLLSRAWACWSC